jgi:hypothetical protein
MHNHPPDLQQAPLKRGKEAAGNKDQDGRLVARVRQHLEHIGENRKEGKDQRKSVDGRVTFLLLSSFFRQDEGGKQVA